MKKIGKPKTKIISSVKLYLDDIEEIINIISSKCKSVTISDNEYEFENLDQLISKRGKYPTNIVLSGMYPYINLSFNRSNILLWSRIYCEEGEDGEYMYNKILELLERRQKILSKISSLKLSYIFFLLLIGSPFIISIFGVDTARTIIILLALTIPYMVLSIIYKTGFAYSIELNKKSEIRSFWRNNYESILLLFIGSLITLLLDLLIRSIFK